MRFITCLFDSPTDFLVSYSEEWPEGRLLVPIRRDLALGEDLLLEVWFPALPNKTLIRGTVSDFDEDGRAAVRLNASDAHARDYLLDAALGRVSAHQQVTRSHRRIPASLPVSCRIDEIDEPADREVTGHTHDVGAGGIFVHTISPPAVGTRVKVVIGPAPGSSRTYQVGGRVAWIRRDPRAHGFGVKFDAREHDGPALRAALRRAWESGRLALA